MASYPGRGHRYDLTVVGAGVAGSEAAFRAAQAGLDVLLVTTSLDTLYMLAHDRTRLQPAPGTLMGELVEGVAEEDGRVERWELHRAAKYRLEATAGIHLLQSNVVALLADEGGVSGVHTWEGVERLSKVTALCVGSFLGSRLEQGALREASGRLGEMAYDDLLHDLERRGVAFVDRVLSLDEEAEGPPYTVTCRVITAAEMDGFAVSKLPGLFAAGVCSGEGESYEAAAAQGRELGDRLVELLRSEAE